MGAGQSALARYCDLAGIQISKLRSLVKLSESARAECRSIDTHDVNPANENLKTTLYKTTRRRIKAEAAEKRFEYLVNSVNGIVWEADATCLRFLFVSWQAERALGYPVERWLSEPTFWQDHLHPDDREWAVQFCLNATFEKGSHDIQYRMLAADGSLQQGFAPIRRNTFVDIDATDTPFVT